MSPQILLPKSIRWNGWRINCWPGTKTGCWQDIILILANLPTEYRLVNRKMISIENITIENKVKAKICKNYSIVYFYKRSIHNVYLTAKFTSPHPHELQSNVAALMYANPISSAYDHLQQTQKDFHSPNATRHLQLQLYVPVDTEGVQTM